MKEEATLQLSDAGSTAVTYDDMARFGTLDASVSLQLTLTRRRDQLGRDILKNVTLPDKNQKTEQKLKLPQMIMSQMKYRNDEVL